MSETQSTWVIVIGLLVISAILAWINPWLVLAVPVGVLFIAATDDSKEVSLNKDIAELKHQLVKKDDRNNYLNNELLREQRKSKVLELERNELKSALEALKNPGAEMRQVELDAEKEITGGA